LILVTNAIATSAAFCEFIPTPWPPRRSRAPGYITESFREY
jgi:hypothetical protein